MLKILIGLLLFPFFVNSQITIRGNVKDKITGKPIENASVYYNLTQIGTKTNEEGNFMLYTTEAFKEIVISSIGYDKIIIDAPNSDKIFNIKLSEKNNTLKEVVVVNKKLNWDKWGELFFKLLMSDDPHDYYNSSIKNPEVITLVFDNNTKELSAFNSEPIIVDHVRLGYQIRIDLEDFKYNFISEKLDNSSTIYFEDNLTKKSALQSVQLSTNYSYYGSKLHFFRSLVNYKLKDEGFKIYKYTSVRNNEKMRIEECINKLKLEKFRNNSIQLRFKMEDVVKNKDSLKYYLKVLDLPSVFSEKLEEIDEKSILSFDTNEKLFRIKFTDTLLVKYTANREKYLIHTRGVESPYDTSKTFELKSFVYLVDNQPFYINSDGQSFSNNLFISGRMGQNRLASILPGNFNPNVPRLVINHNSSKSP